MIQVCREARLASEAGRLTTQQPKAAPLTPQLPSWHVWPCACVCWTHAGVRWDLISFCNSLLMMNGDSPLVYLLIIQVFPSMSFAHFCMDFPFSFLMCGGFPMFQVLTHSLSRVLP